MYESPGVGNNRPVRSVSAFLKASTRDHLEVKVLSVN